ncbi:MAG: ABC transporter permease [Chloroflexi bacterium]|nr:ABC transporter permease [Chloroflexota bacterium]
MAKFLSDAGVVFQIQMLKTRTWAPFYILSVLIVPVGTLYFAKALIPPGAEDAVGTRLVTGSLVFGIGLMTVNNLAQLMLFERFALMLKLMITSPISRYSYALGIVGFSLVQGMLTAAVLLACAPLVVGVDVHLDWRLVPILMLTAVSLTGIGIIIATWCPSQEIGGMLANTVGIMVTLLSPVYYPMERLPDWLRAVVHLSPYTYAGSAVDALLSGSGDVGANALWLTMITLGGVTIGTLGLRWREN